MKSYLFNLVLRVIGVLALVFVLIALIPGDSRSYFAGAFESSGLSLGDRNINPWTFEYMRFHMGERWTVEIFESFLRSTFLATLSAILSFALFIGFFSFLTFRTRDFLDLSSAFFLSLVSVLVSPLIAVFYMRFGGEWASYTISTYFVAALSLSFVALGTYIKYLVTKDSQIETQNLYFGLNARGIKPFTQKWVHFSKLLLPDFLVLFLHRYATYISGVFVAELVFNIRGMGWLFSQAFQSRSGLLLLILTLMGSVLYLLLNHLALTLASFLDRRRVSNES